jgi:hypothetical protein
MTEQAAEHQQRPFDDDDEAGRFLWCIDPEAAVSLGGDAAALRLAADAVAQGRVPVIESQGEPVTHDD